MAKKSLDTLTKQQSPPSRSSALEYEQYSNIYAAIIYLSTVQFEGGFELRTCVTVPDREVLEPLWSDYYGG